MSNLIASPPAVVPSGGPRSRCSARNGAQPVSHYIHRWRLRLWGFANLLVESLRSPPRRHCARPRGWSQTRVLLLVRQCRLRLCLRRVDRNQHSCLVLVQFQESQQYPTRTLRWSTTFAPSKSHSSQLRRNTCAPESLNRDVLTRTPTKRIREHQQQHTNKNNNSNSDMTTSCHGWLFNRSCFRAIKSIQWPWRCDSCVSWPQCNKWFPDNDQTQKH